METSHPTVSLNVTQMEFYYEVVGQGGVFHTDMYMHITWPSVWKLVHRNRHVVVQNPLLASRENLLHYIWDSVLRLEGQVEVVYVA